MADKFDFNHELLIVLNKIATSMDVMNERLQWISESIDSVPSYSDEALTECLSQIKTAIERINN